MAWLYHTALEAAVHCLLALLTCTAAGHSQTTQQPPPNDPLASDEWRSGQAAPVRWIFNNNGPSLNLFG
jgi:hypothetical protein